MYYTAGQVVMAEQLVSKETIDEMREAAQVKWYEPLMVAGRRVAPDWLVYTIAIGIPLTLQNPAVAEVARSPWSLAVVVPVAIGLSVMSMRNRRNREEADNGVETRLLSQMGEAAVIAGGVTAAMMLNSFAKDAGQVVGFLAKGAEVVVAGSIGLLSYWALKGREQKRKNIACEEEIKNLNKKRVAYGIARGREVVKEVLTNAVEATRDELILSLTEKGLPVSPMVFNLIEKELVTVAKGLKSRDRDKLKAQLTTVVEDGLGDKIDRFARNLVGSSETVMFVTGLDGKTAINGDAVDIMVNDERVGPILALASSNPAGLGKKGRN